MNAIVTVEVERTNRARTAEGRFVTAVSVVEVLVGPGECPELIAAQMVAARIGEGMVTATRTVEAFEV